MNKCKACGENLEPDWDECPVCETPVTKSFNCSECGRELKSNWRKCPYCKTITEYGSLVEVTNTPRKSFAEVKENNIVTDNTGNKNNKKEVTLNQETRKLNYNDNYVKYLESVIVKDKVYFDGNILDLGSTYGEIISGIDAIKLLKERITIKTTLIDGRIFLFTKSSDYITYEKMEELKTIFGQLSKETIEKDNNNYLELYLEGQKEKSRYELDKLYDKSEYAISDLFFGKNYAFLFEEDSKSFKCLKKAEEKANYSSDWGLIAEGWKQIFNDKKEAERCLRRAGGTALGSTGWEVVAQGRKKLFNDESEARRYLIKAEKSISSFPIEFAFVAVSWKEVFNDDINARRCLKEAESGAEFFENWIHIAKIWRKLFNDESEARRCLKQAEIMADDTSDWTKCSEAWTEIFNDQNEAKRNIKQTGSSSGFSNLFNSLNDLTKKFKS